MNSINKIYSTNSIQFYSIQKLEHYFKNVIQQTKKEKKLNSNGTGPDNTHPYDVYWVVGKPGYDIILDPMMREYTSGPNIKATVMNQ